MLCEKVPSKFREAVRGRTEPARGVVPKERLTRARGSFTKGEEPRYQIGLGGGFGRPHV